MNTDELKQLFSTREVLDLEKSEQDFDRSIRFMLRDRHTQELGVLEISAVEVALPRELWLEYKYESLSDREHLEDQIDAWSEDPLHGVTAC